MIQDLLFGAMLHSFSEENRAEFKQNLKALSTKYSEFEITLAFGNFEQFMNDNSLNIDEKIELAKQKTLPEIVNLLKILKKETRSRGFERVESELKFDDGLPARNPMPQRGTKSSAGYDLRAYGSYIIKAGEMVIVHTGITAYMQEDEFLDVRIRSGHAYSHQLTLQNSCGVIDADYYGKEIKLMVRNESDRDFYLNHGDRVGQGIFLPYFTTDDDKPADTEREGGFGSTGKE